MSLVVGSCLLPGLFPSLCPVCCLVRVSCVQHVLSFWSKTGGLCFVSVAVCVPRLVYDMFVVLVVVFFPLPVPVHIPLGFVLLFPSPIVKFICLPCVSVCVTSSFIFDTPSAHMCYVSH